MTSPPAYGVTGSNCATAAARSESPAPGRRGAVGAFRNGRRRVRRPHSLARRIAGACVLLIDGLGADLLDTYAEDAPVLAGLRGQTLQVGFPSTTAAGLAAIGTGCRSGEHGMVGLSFRLPGADVVNALGWRPHPRGPRPA